MYKVLLIIALVLCAGCGRHTIETEVPACPAPVISKDTMIEQIRLRQADLVEFAAKGSAEVNMLAEGRKESLNNVTAYFSDKENIVIRVSHTFGTALLLGTNDDQFWYWLNFSDINDLYRGRKELLESCGARGLKTFPASETFGIIDTDGLADSQMFFGEYEHGFDIIDENGYILRSYSFNNCSGQLSRIAYYERGGLVVSADFSDFMPLNGSMMLPGKTRIFSLRDSLELEFDTSRIIPLSLSESKKAKLYSMPKPSKDTNIYELNDDCYFQSTDDDRY